MPRAAPVTRAILAVCALMMAFSGVGWRQSLGILRLQCRAFVSDEDDQQASWGRPADVTGEDVVGAGQLEPTLPGVEGLRGFALELTFDVAGEHVGVDEGASVAVR